MSASWFLVQCVSKSKQDFIKIKGEKGLLVTGIELKYVRWR